MAQPAVACGVEGRPRRAVRLRWFGPAFVAAIAYVDPGNFSTNFQAGAGYGYLLTWVVVVANLVAVLVQYLSAKIGLATARDLPTVCRDTYPRPLVRLMWVQAELVAMATDIAEFVGAAVGFNLLAGLPLPAAAVVTGVVSFALLAVQQRRYRWFELVIGLMFAAIALWFGYELSIVGHPSPGAVADGLVPRFHGTESVALAAGIVGATVMPHAAYLHSALTARRPPTAAHERRSALRLVRADCVVGLGIAGAVNVLMLWVAVALLHRLGHGFDGGLRAVHADLAHAFGGTAALVFAFALLSSGLSSSGVGTFAGQVVMQGFTRRRIPLPVRRAATMLPALVLLACGVPADTLLLSSQVALSFGIPFVLVPLVRLTSRRDLMGDLVNSRAVTAAATLVAVTICGLNLYLIEASV